VKGNASKRSSPRLASGGRSFLTREVEGRGERVAIRANEKDKQIVEGPRVGLDGSLQRRRENLECIAGLANEGGRENGVKTRKGRGAPKEPRRASKGKCERETPETC